MSCRGICVAHATTKAFRGHHYVNDEKRCQVCSVYIKWNGDFCPCCHLRLRTRPRNTHYKAKWREMIIA